MENTETEKIKGLIESFTAEYYDPQLLGTFQDWLANEANEDVKDDALFDLWGRVGATGGKAHADMVFRRISRQVGIIAVDGKQVLRRNLLRAAAVAAAVLITGPAIWLYNNRPAVDNNVPLAVADTTENTEEKKEKYMLLADGSQVWLQNESVVKIEGQRENTLVGDALYNVKREYVSGRRFTVHTEYLEATVLGTVFRITALPDSDESVITLYEGALEVTTPESTVSLASGTKFTYNHESGEYRLDDIADLWPEQLGARLIHYRSEDIASVFKEIERLYGVEVDFHRFSWTSEKVTMKFSSATNLENVMYMLSGISGNFTYSITDDRVYIHDK